MGAEPSPFCRVGPGAPFRVCKRDCLFCSWKRNSRLQAVRSVLRGKHLAHCPKRSQVSGARVLAGCTELTPFPSTSCVFCLPSSPRCHPCLPNSLNTPSSPSSLLRCLLPRLQSAHLLSRGKTRRGGIPPRERPGGHWACSVVKQVRSCEQLWSLTDSSCRLLRSRERAHDGGGCRER